MAWGDQFAGGHDWTDSKSYSNREYRDREARDSKSSHSQEKSQRESKSQKRDRDKKAREARAKAKKTAEDLKARKEEVTTAKASMKSSSAIRAQEKALMANKPKSEFVGARKGMTGATKGALMGGALGLTTGIPGMTTLGYYAGKKWLSDSPDKPGYYRDQKVKEETESAISRGDQSDRDSRGGSAISKGIEEKPEESTELDEIELARLEAKAKSRAERDEIRRRYGRRTGLNLLSFTQDQKLG